MPDTDHRYVLRRQVLSQLQAARPATLKLDELLGALNTLGDDQGRREAREAVELLVTLGYVEQLELEDVGLVRITPDGTRQLKKLTTHLDPAIWGALAL